MKFRVVGSMIAAFVMISAAFSGIFAQEINSPVGAKRVIMIGYDGYGSHYVKWDQVPNLAKLRDGGAWSLKKRSVLPSVSAINWATMTMGADSEFHGFRTWGSKEPDLPSVTLTENGLFPDIFYLLRQTYPDSRLYSAYSWDGIGYIFDKKSANRASYCETDESVMFEGLSFFAERPTFAFIYFKEPDEAGHTNGWGSEEYDAIVRDLDLLLGKLIDYLEASDMMKDTVILFTSDHGGTEKGHGEGIMEHMETPFILYGCGVQPGEITDTVIGYDVAATIAWILGAQQPQAWRGKAITSAFGK